MPTLPTVNTVVSSQIAIQGAYAIARVWASAVAKAATAGTDLGYVQNIGGSSNPTTKDIKSARAGKSQIVKSVSTGDNVEVTFDSLSVLDPAVLQMHAGGAPTASKYKRSTTAQRCELWIVYPNAEDSEDWIVDYYGAVDLKGNGKTAGDGENEAVLSFTAKAVVDSTDAVNPLGWTQVVADRAAAETLIGNV